MRKREKGETREGKQTQHKVLTVRKRPDGGKSSRTLKERKQELKWDISGEHLRILSCLTRAISLYALVGPHCSLALEGVGVHFPARSRGLEQQLGCLQCQDDIVQIESLKKSHFLDGCYAVTELVFLLKVSMCYIMRWIDWQKSLVFHNQHWDVQKSETWIFRTGNSCLNLKWTNAWFRAWFRVV